MIHLQMFTNVNFGLALNKFYKICHFPTKKLNLGGFHFIFNVF